MLRLESFRRVANAWLNFATLWVDSEPLIRMRNRPLRITYAIRIRTI
jgi:hypothetical protein